MPIILAVALLPENMVVFFGGERWETNKQQNVSCHKENAKKEQKVYQLLSKYICTEHFFSNINQL